VEEARRTPAGRMPLALVGAAIATALAVVPCAGAAAAPKPGTQVERTVHSAAPDAHLVKESFVRVYKPLPKRDGPHPKACDWISYLRYRNAGGPRKPSRADAVFVIIPGFLGGAGSFDQVARNTVRDAAKRGKDVEFWALDRRSNCLEDDRGVKAAARAKDPSVGYDYYWHGKPIHGKRFGGWVSQKNAAWLKHVGLGQTLRDWYTVLKAGIPSRRVRDRKVFCGGHSMGGPITAAFASWDFDNDPKTKSDAGYRQCAGFVGLDTRLVVGTPSIDPTNPSAVLLAAVIASGSPYVDVPPIVPETIQLPPIFGVGAFYHPNRTDLLRRLPHSRNIDLAQRFLFSRDAVNFATGRPSIRDFTISNDADLAGVFDDNSAPLFFMRSSLGFLKGGPLTDKNFPSKNPSLALPADTNAPLYSWQNYDEVGKNGRRIPLNDEGDPYTSREGEASDIHQFARTQFESPANFIEQYFPTKLLKDLQKAGQGNRSGSLSHLKYDDGPSRRPAIIVRAGDSLDNSAPDSGPPIKGQPPNKKPLSRSITVPGYNHLDVLTAARRQNDGRPEPTSRALANFARKVTR
jgi:pimeloyl-ACP methyl ester carboxylesterase